VNALNNMGSSSTDRVAEFKGVQVSPMGQSMFV
jgi:hypothetical protein